MWKCSNAGHGKTGTGTGSGEIGRPGDRETKHCDGVFRLDV
jgi:hypothetical protein